MSGSYAELKRVERKLIHNGRVIDYYQDTMQLPDGKTTVWDYIDHDGASAIVPVTSEGKILMVRQFRNTASRAMLELPAGKKNTREEDGARCAARELEEETGYTAGSLVKLTTIYPSVAYCGEKIDMYAAFDLERSAQNLDEDEFINVEAYTPKELTDLILDGTIQDAKTICGILIYARRFLDSAF